MRKHRKPAKQQASYSNAVTAYRRVLDPEGHWPKQEQGLGRNHANNIDLRIDAQRERLLSTVSAGEEREPCEHNPAFGTQRKARPERLSRPLIQHTQHTLASSLSEGLHL